MTTIDNSQKTCTLINVFTVQPEKHLELVNLLKNATLEVISKLPGYVSANIHISDDKNTVTNYAQWATAEDFHHMLQNAEAQSHLKKAATLVMEFKPVTYSEIWCHSNH